MRPACGFFPAIFLSPTTLPYLTLRLNSCHSLPMTAALVHFYPLPCYLATRQSLIFQSIERDFPSAVDYLSHVPGHMPSFLFLFSFPICYAFPCDVARGGVRSYLPAGSVTACSRQKLHRQHVMRWVRADRPVSRTLALANIRPALSSRGLPDVSVVE